MGKRVLAFSVGFLVLMMMPTHADDRLICGETTYDIEQRFVGGSVTAVTAAGTTPFCISDNPAERTQTLSFRDQEVWCVTWHHLSSNSRPLAKQLWVLNRLSNKLYQYDYVFAEGAWILQDERHETCKAAQQN